MDTPRIERYKAFTLKTYHAFWDYYIKNTNKNVKIKSIDENTT